MPRRAILLRRSFPGGVEVVAVPDYMQPFDWAPLLDGVEAVVHLAGIAHIGPGIDAAVYDRVIHAATAELVAACRRARIKRFVFMSSVRAQSGACADRRADRGPTRRVRPKPTAAPSSQAEAAVQGADIAWTILRPVMVYGPGAKGNLASLQRLADDAVAAAAGALHGAAARSSVSTT